MSLDRRLRNGLHLAADEDLPEFATVEALARVRGRVRRRSRRLRAAGSVLVAAAATAVVTLGPSALDGARRDTGAVVAAATDLRGSYLVEVEPSVGAEADGLVGRWVVTLGSRGVVEVAPPVTYEAAVSGIAWAVEDGQFRTDALNDVPGCQVSGEYVGVYTWTVDGDIVRFRVVADGCSARRTLFAGQVWRRLD